MKTKRGSALIISLLLLTFMSVSVLMISHLVISETKITTRYQDEIIAKYAAESGMEWTLAKLKYDPTYGIEPGGTVNIKSGCAQTGLVPVPNAGTIPIQIGPITVGANNLACPTYEVQLTRTVPSTASGVTITINKDETKEINLTNAQRQTWRIESAVIEPASCGSINNLFTYVEIKEFKRGNNQNADTSPVQEQLLNAVSNTRGLWSGQTYMPSIETDFIRIRPIVVKQAMPKTAAALTGNANSVLGANCRVELKLNYRGQEYIDQSYAQIKSTGRFNSAKRAVGANIDNTSGRLLDIFDFVIYAGDTLDVK